MFEVGRRALGGEGDIQARQQVVFERRDDAVQRSHKLSLWEEEKRSSVHPGRQGGVGGRRAPRAHRAHRRSVRVVGLEARQLARPARWRGCRRCGSVVEGGLACFQHRPGRLPASRSGSLRGGSRSRRRIDVVVVDAPAVAPSGRGARPRGRLDVVAVYAGEVGWLKVRGPARSALRLASRVPAGVLLVREHLLRRRPFGVRLLWEAPLAPTAIAPTRRWWRRRGARCRGS